MKRNENLGENLTGYDRHTLKIKINILDSMKLNTSGYKKLEYSYMEKDIMFENTTLSKNNSFLYLSGENNSKKMKNNEKNDFILSSTQFIDVKIALFQ